MKRHATIVLVFGLLLLAAGCQQQTIKESRKDAYGKWSVSRAKVLYSLAKDHLAGGFVDKACAKAEEGLSLDPTNKDLQMLLARIYIEKGFYTRAIALLEPLARSEREENAEKRSPLLAEVYYLLGAAQEKEGRLEEALASYNEAAELDRSTSAPIQAATEVLISSGKISEARDFLSAHMNRYAPEPALAELAGRLAIMRREYAEAAKYFQTACDLDPQNMRYPELLASAWYSAGEYARAGETLGKLIRRNGYKGGAWVYRLHGDCMMAQRHHQAAEKSYQRACLLRPDDADGWVRLAKAALVQNHLTKAIRSAHQARRIEEGHREASLLLGYALLRIDQPQKAADILAETVREHPRDELALCLLGRAYSRLGREDLAQQCYQAAARVQPDFPLLEGLRVSAR